MPTSWGAGDYEVLSATLQRPAPLRHTHVSLEPGMTVLYGRNGAGKSRVLEAIRASVEGVRGRSWAWLHVRLSRADERTTGGLVEELLHAVDGLPGPRLESGLADKAAAFAGRHGAPGGEDVFVHPPAELRWRVFRHVLQAFEAFVDDDELVVLADEVARDGVFTLMPSGVAGSRQWLVYASALPGPRTPALAARAEEYRRSWEAALRLPGEDERQSALVSAGQSFGLLEDGGMFLDDSDPVPFSSWGGPVPLLQLGTLDRRDPLCEIYGLDGQDLLDRTLARLRLRGPGRRPVFAPGTDTVDPDVQRELDELSGIATDIYATVLERAPRLVCSLRPLDEWLEREPLAWVADDVDGPPELAIADLSEAQRRWAEVAIGAALAVRSPDVRALMLLDEPEQALHVRAVRRMASGLKDLAASQNVDVLAATHSAALLELPGVRLSHVARAGGGETEVRPLRLDLADATLSELGLTRSEGLTLTRTFVVVEGMHDKAVVERVGAQALESSRARVLAARGGKQISSMLQNSFLLDSTDADFLVVMDGLSAEEVAVGWLTAQDAWREGRESADLKRLLSELFPGGERAENLFVRDLMLSALTSGSARRIRFAPLAKRDIVCYLPHQRFLSTGSWEDDETAFDEAYAAAQTRRAAGSTEKLPVFKSWLTENRGADFGDDAVLAAVEAMDAVHDDLVRLVSAIADPG